MRLDARQVQFTTSFLPTWRTRTLRLGGRRGSMDLQEPALVIEGELLRFRLLGIEWLFRRALSEWTTVTVPYSRIVGVRKTWVWLVRALLVLGILVIAVFVAGSFRASPWTDGTTAAVAILLAVAVVLAYALVRVRPRTTIVYRTKVGRRTQVTILVRKREARQAFLELLAAHRAAAARHTAKPVLATVQG